MNEAEKRMFGVVAQAEARNAQMRKEVEDLLKGVEARNAGLLKGLEDVDYRERELRRLYHIGQDHMAEDFRGVGQRFGQVDQRFGDVDKKFAVVDRKFGQVHQRFGDVDEKFAAVHRDFGQVDANHRSLLNRVAELERQMQVYKADTTAKINDLRRELLMSDATSARRDVMGGGPERRGRDPAEDGLPMQKGRRV